MKPETAAKDRLISVDELDCGIRRLACRINAATYELLVLVRQFDGRAAPSCGYRAQDVIDDGFDDIDNTISELSCLINNPSAEGLLTAVKTLPNH